MKRPLYHVVLNTDKLLYHDEFVPGMDSFTMKVAAKVTELDDELITNACIEAARQEGVDRLWLVDKKFVADAIREKIEREMTKED